MSTLIPYQLHPFFRVGDWWTDLTPVRLFDQDFGLQLFDDRHHHHHHHHHPLGAAMPYWLRPQRSAGANNQETGGLSEVHNDKDKFSVKLDVSHFTPEEIKVKAVENGLVITGKHEEKMDQHGFVSRAFTRRYVLPKDIDPATLTSKLTNDGVLYVEAPKKQLAAPNERNIPIQMGAAPQQSIEKKKEEPTGEKKKEEPTVEKKDK